MTSLNNRSRGAVLRPRQQWQRWGVSRSTYYKARSEDPRFPPQFSLTAGGRAVGTFEEDFDAYLQAKAEEQAGGAA